MNTLLAGVLLLTTSAAFQPQEPPAGPAGPGPGPAEAPTTVRPVVLHVAPTGDDSKSGETAELALKSPNGARDRLRAIRAGNGGKLPGPATVVFEPGRYELAEPWVLEPVDSGTAEAPVEYVAGGPVILSAGTILGDWRAAEFNGRMMWAADLPASFEAGRDGGPAFRSMWITGERKTWARYPNGGQFAEVAGIPEKPEGDWTKGSKSFAFGDADAEGWKRVEAGAEVVTFSRWIDTHMRLAGVEGTLARLETPPMIGLEKGDLYYVEGSPKLLDEPGEWWCDAGARVLYYLPRPGEDPTGRAVIPRLDTVLRIAGKPEANEWVEHVAFRGLGMAYARWWFTPTTGSGVSGFGSPGAVGFAQAAAGAPGAVRAEGARKVLFEGCNVFAVEGYGIELGHGCRDCVIRGTEVSDLGAGGIKIGEASIAARSAGATAGNIVEDCLIEDGGNIHHQAVGVWIGQSPDNILRHNRIQRFDYTGISIGWTWGYGPATAGGNLVEFNEVCNLGDRPERPRPPLGDMGGIYTLGTQHGTIIRNNYFHEIAGRSIAWGIYFDEGTTGVLAENNAVVNTTHGGFHQHYGRDNTVRNNIFIGGRDGALQRSRVEDHTSFVFTRNIVVGMSSTWLVGDWSKGVVMENNLYFRPDGKAIEFPGGKDLTGWQALGFDKGSAIGDPAFTAPQDGDFFPGEPTAMDEIGFEPVSVRRVGPRKPGARKGP